VHDFAELLVLLAGLAAPHHENVFDSGLVEALL
jgi:hypothetical protein